MAVKFRDGDVSYLCAARVLRCTYDMVATLVKTGKLEGGQYPHNERGRYVMWESMCRLWHERLKAQARAYDSARKQLEGKVDE